MNSTIIKGHYKQHCFAGHASASGRNPYFRKHQKQKNERLGRRKMETNLTGHEKKQRCKLEMSRFHKAFSP